MKLILYLLAFLAIPVIAGLISSHRAGVMPYQVRKRKIIHSDVESQRKC
tara:strand:- start:281 stop:427 length:147 start_codon:yes stop_codon:yes gene_type:complete